MRELYKLILKCYDSVDIKDRHHKRICHFSKKNKKIPKLQVMKDGFVVMNDNVLDTRFNIKFFHDILNSCNYNDSQKKFDRSKLYYSLKVDYKSSSNDYVISNYYSCTYFNDRFGCSPPIRNSCSSSINYDRFGCSPPIRNSCSSSINYDRFGCSPPIRNSCSSSSRNSRCSSSSRNSCSSSNRNSWSSSSRNSCSSSSRNSRCSSSIQSLCGYQFYR